MNCSSISKIMTEPRAKKDKEAGILSETCKQYVREWAIQEQYGRRKIVTSKPMLKGTQEEAASLMLLEDYRGQNGLFKNEQRFENEWMKGYPDVINGDEVIEVKTPYDLFTFHKSEGLKTASSYTSHGWQLIGYLGLTGLHYGILAYVLSDTPAYIVDSEVRKMWYAMHIETPEEQEWFDNEVEPKIRANHTYSNVQGFPDIPLFERVAEFDLEFDEKAYNDIVERVELINHYLINDPEKIWK